MAANSKSDVESMVLKLSDDAFEESSNTVMHLGREFVPFSAGPRRRAIKRSWVFDLSHSMPLTCCPSQQCQLTVRGFSAVQSRALKEDGISQMDVVEACQCLRNWQRRGFRTDAYGGVLGSLFPNAA
jgi:hypothetical protein